MVLLETLVFGTFSFGSYAIGRMGHVTAGHWDTPHHWIYGIILLFLGILYAASPWSIYAIAIGMGLWISDWYDFLDLRLWGPDKHIKKAEFWGFD